MRKTFCRWSKVEPVLGSRSRKPRLLQGAEAGAIKPYLVGAGVNKVPAPQQWVQQTYFLPNTFFINSIKKKRMKNIFSCHLQEEK